MCISKFVLILSLCVFVTPAYSKAEKFNAKADAAIFRNAVEVSGINDRHFIDIVTKRGVAERKKIARAYKTLYGTNFMDDVREKSEGIEGYIINALMIPPPQYYATELWGAFYEVPSVDDEAIVEILCSLNNCAMRSSTLLFKKLYNKTLESVFEDKTSGDFKRLLMSLCQANRDEYLDVDKDQAAADAKYLYDLIDKRTPTEDVTRFNLILEERSYNQLNQIFAEYKAISNHDIEIMIQEKLFDSIRKLVLGIMNRAKSKYEFLARILYSSNNFRTIIRIIVTQSNAHLNSFAKAFLKVNKESLKHWIDKHALLDENIKYILGSIVTK